MADFRYKAMKASGGMTSGVLSAASEADAIQQIRNLGYLPVSATHAADKASPQA